jgi:flagellar protein FliO/FliZ
MLGNRQFLVVAEYEDRKMLIGVCPGRIDYLATLSAPEADFPDVQPEKNDE